MIDTKGEVCNIMISTTTQKKLELLYLQNPCRTLPNAFWKTIRDADKTNCIINNDDVVLCNEFITLANSKSNYFEDKNEYTRYFRLIYDFKNKKLINDDGFAIIDVSIENEYDEIHMFINSCYANISITAEEVEQWCKHPVFNSNLWIWIVDKTTNERIGLGIAEYDNSIKEGSLEWIQVLPKYQGKGVGKAIVYELLRRLEKANIITVSGEVDNQTNPEKLYRSCGFMGDDIWLLKRNGD
jgi:GNAT superfamily N-acetyltransferase